MITSPRRPQLMAASANPAGEAGTSGYRSSSGIAVVSSPERRRPLSALRLPAQRIVASSPRALLTALRRDVDVMPEMPEAEAKQGSPNGSRALSARRPRCWNTPTPATAARWLLRASTGSPLPAPSGCWVRLFWRDRDGQDRSGQISRNHGTCGSPSVAVVVGEASQFQQPPRRSRHVRIRPRLQTGQNAGQPRPLPPDRPQLRGVCLTPKEPHPWLLNRLQLARIWLAPRASRWLEQVADPALIASAQMRICGDQQVASWPAE